MKYNKQDAVMTRGLAILCMLILHLFCRKGADVYGTPLLWLNDTTPGVCWFGFYAGICAHLYSLCAGYAQELIYENAGGGNTWKKNVGRAWKLLKNYWVVLALFCCIGLIVKPAGKIPGSFQNLLKSVFLLHSYNGAWWYLNTYLILMLIPVGISLYPVRRIRPSVGIGCVVVLAFLWYLVERFSLIPDISTAYPAMVFLRKELVNLIGVFPAFWAGAFLCKGKYMDRIDEWLSAYFPAKRNLVLLTCWMLLFIGVNLLEKAMLALVSAILTFIIFNMLYKTAVVQKVFLFLGKHSTNIWLTHMFFYCTDPFNGLVQRAKYPLLMLAFMLILCIVASYIVNFLLKLISAKTMRGSQWDRNAMKITNNNQL